VVYLYQKQGRTTFIFRRHNMNLHYDKKTGRAKGYLTDSYRKAIEEIINYLSLELPYFSVEEIPNDLFNRTHTFINDVRANFIDNTLMYYLEQGYITTSDCRSIFKSFYETIAQLEDIYLYKTIYRKSKFHLEFGFNYEKYKIYKMMNE
jgi:hypothetical protein